MKINEVTIREACNKLAETLIAKNKDYGNSVEEQFNEYGPLSVSIRLDDKMRRLKNLQFKSHGLVPESIADTLLDSAGYSILGHILLSSKDTCDMNFNPHFDQDDQY